MTYLSSSDVNEESGQIILRPQGYAAAIVLALVAAALLAGGWKSLAGFTAVALATALIAWLGYCAVKGNCDKILIGWVFLYPLGYYLLSYPRDRPVIQFDRMLILFIIMGMLTAPKFRTREVQADLKRVAIAFGLFLAVTGLSFFTGAKTVTVGRLIVDTLLLPAILGLYIVRQFRLEGNEKWLHAAICVISVYCAVIGVLEVATQTDLLAFQSSEDYLLNDPSDPTAFIFLRPNGPFMANNTYAIAGLISFFLLGFLWTVIRDNSGPVRRVLHLIGMTAALIQAMLPVFRSIFITLVIAAIIDLFWTAGFRRMLRLAFVGLVLTSAIIIGIMFPSVSQDRTSAANIYGRFAQDRQTWRIFIDNPVFGVGLYNFTPVAKSESRYQADLDNAPPLNYPHNNLGWLTAETGLVGIIPFLLSQVLLVAAFRRLAKRGAHGHSAWRFFVFIFLSYWITGMSETAAEYGELNMWFVFAVALLYLYGTSENPQRALADA